MTTYNTGNPIGSKDPRDLYDNAENLDQAINSSLSSFIDRLGVNRETLYGALLIWTSVYQGPAASNPTTRKNGTALQNGDIYFNTSTKRMMAYANGLWYATETEGATDADLVTFLPSGASATTVQQKLRTFGTDSSGMVSTPGAAAIAVNGTRTTIDNHAFEDWTNIATTSQTNRGYACFDAKPTMTNQASQSHFVGYQARMVYNGAGGIADYMDGFNTAMVHNGSGVVATVTGLKIADVGGTGPITTNYGIYVGEIARGATNWGIYSYNYKNYFRALETEGVITPASGLGLGNFHKDHPLKRVVFGYGDAGQVNKATYTWYDGITSTVMTLDSQRLTMNVALKCRSYTRDSLPVGAEGDTCYCTNGRKVWEAAGYGTGVPVYYSAGVWRVFSTDAVVTA